MKIVPLAIILKKQYDDGNLVCYEVELPYNDKKWFVKISPDNRSVKYYTNQLSTRLIKEIKISADPDAPFETIEGIDTSVSNFITFNVYKALLTKKFPNIISKISS